MENTPAKIETPVIDEAKMEMLSSAVEMIMPKLEPMIAPSLEKLEEFLSSGKIVILCKPSENSGAKVLVINKDSNLCIQGDKFVRSETDKSGYRLSMSSDAIVSVNDVKQFVSKILSGDFK